MGRKLKAVRWKWIGKSLALYESGLFSGSVGERELVAFFHSRRRSGKSFVYKEVVGNDEKTP